MAVLVGPSLCHKGAKRAVSAGVLTMMGMDRYASVNLKGTHSCPIDDVMMVLSTTQAT